MSLLPSPIPHPLDYSPWQLPGWVYEALDWVIGVEWPEGNERAVWELAEQWYAVAAALAGPQADAVAAAGEVRGGYGGVGAVAAAFDTAWRRVAEGDEAPLPVLFAVSTELGRLVEECGCDIEGAKLEVWIELGILVVELLSLAVATVLTAGAASPAAGVAITATRLIVQQIFKRLMAQLARKSLKQGLKEAGERAAKEVTKGGVRGFSRRAAVSGLSEAAEESGINLATQAYQNSTGRRHGLDVTELGTTALGGMAGGMVAPLAGLGRHATGRSARIGEHFGREMAGEVMADQAASLATGQGLTSVEDAARAAASGARGSATAQADAALQARLDGQLSALAGMPLTSSGAGGLPTPPGMPAAEGPSVAAPSAGAESSTQGPGASTGVHDEGQRGTTDAETTPAARPTPEAEAAQAGVATTTADRAATTTAPVTGTGIERTAAVSASVSPESAPSPSLSSVTAAAPVLANVGVSTGVDFQTTVSGNAPSGTGPANVASAAGPPNVPAAAPVGGPSAGMGTATVGPASVSFPEPRTGVAVPGAVHVSPAATAEPAVTRGVVGAVPAQSAPPTLLPSPAAPTSGQNPHVRSDSAEAAGRDGPAEPRVRTPEWYAAKWALDRDAFERRRYRGYYESQRAWFEDKRRFDEAVRLRARADEHHHRAQDFAAHALHLHRTGQARQADRWHWAANDEMRTYGQYLDHAEAVLAGSVVPSVVGVVDPADFRRINDDVGDLAYGAVETSDRSALTGDDHPPPIDRSRNYGRPGGLRPPLALHQTDVERQMPREPDGSVRRNADPRTGGWFGLVNDGGPRADPTRGINCIDCTLSLFDTWLHGRPRVAAPRTFDAYVAGDVARPINGERDGTGRVEDVTGGRFQRLCQPTDDVQGAERQRAIDTGYRNLHAQLRLGGHGSFAFVVNSFEQGGSHIWVALNQNGTILYLDPQSGAVSDAPLYQHRGTPHPYNAVDTEVLVLGSDGRPMPLGGLRRGRFSERPDLPQYPPAETDEGYGELYLNRVYLLEGPGSVGSGPSLDDDPPDQAGPGESSPLLGQLSHQERSVLATLRGQAVAAADEVESALTKAGRRVTETLRLDHPIILRDQEFRVKALDSLFRKYLDEAQAVGVSVEEFSRGVNDVLRFSFSMPPKARYRGAVQAILVELREMGFVVGDEDCKNFWRAGNRFYGFNCTITSPGGQTFELQLHSDLSRKSWMLTHQAYEVLRRSSEPPERRIHALMQMLSVNRQSGIPDQVPIGLSEEFPAKDATFVKWILVNRGVWSDYLRWLRREGRSFSQVVEEFGLAMEDFPIAQELLERLEKSDADLLRDLPRRRQS
ncbi:toxin glutamine deamidase domain-containing protein [Micromonospora peucetia]|uniref:Papain fold toxin 1, glutamine deamidase n=1 Tax=Micromonospora peucetia TaxID=47871 RepID=A0A1C6UE46_9ACTN|nr:toxin glutamine deamidase domain-containing protein [Micromonospora peucetia]WSA33901.1 toxin glutamine deamidase domain-containing protein [Micromonospora peucetia]SCL52211.1 Papain fold toxin 1, glutamine deamidase [Micromonospora peucetia]